MATPLIARVTSNYILQEDDMPLLTPPDGDPRTPEEYTYDMERAGQTYAKPATSFRMLRTEADDADNDEREDLLIGHIDGVPVLAGYMDDGRLYSALIEWQGVKVSTDGTNYINLPSDDSLGSVGDFHVRDWQMLTRANVIDRLVILAQRYPRFQDVPAVPPVARPVATPPVVCALAVTINRYGVDASDEEYYSFAPGTEYHCGDVFIEVSDNPDEDPNVYGIDGDCISLIEAQQAVQAFQTLLDDPRVRTALAQVKPVQKQGTPTVSVEHLYHNPKRNGDLTSKPVGPLAYVDYVCGEEDTRACISYDVERGDLVGEINGQPIEGSLDDAEQAARNFLILLADPRVQAAFAATQEVAA